MAITQTPLTSGFSDAQDPYTTASIAPSPNKLISLTILLSELTDITAVVISVAGNGLTWVQVNSVEFNGTPAKNRLVNYRAMGASPTTEAITITRTAGNTLDAAAWSVSEFDGVDTSGTNGSGAVVQSAVNSDAGATSLTVTLAAFGSSSNAAYGAFGKRTAEAINPGTGFTEIHEQQTTAPGSTLETEWLSSEDTTVDASWVTALQCGGIGIEIKEAAPAGSRRLREPALMSGMYDMTGGMRQG